MSLMHRLRPEERIMAKNGTVAYVTQLPDCDFCKIDGTTTLGGNPVPALYDLRTKDGRWANVCSHHRVVHAMHSELGLGKGQKLEVKEPSRR